MIKKRKIIIRNLSTFIVLTLMICSLVSALGVSSIYGKTNVLRMYSGEIKDISISVQTTDEEKDMNVKTEITQGSEIAELIDGPEYSLVGGKPSISNLRVQIPNDAELGKEYLLSVKFAEINPESDGVGTVSLVTTTTKTINVLVIEKPEEIKEGMSTTTIILLIVGIIVIIAIIWFVIKKKNE